MHDHREVASLPPSGVLFTRGGGHNFPGAFLSREESAGAWVALATQANVGQGGIGKPWRERGFSDPSCTTIGRSLRSLPRACSSPILGRWSDKEGSGSLGGNGDFRIPRARPSGGRFAPSLGRALHPFLGRTSARVFSPGGQVQAPDLVGEVGVVQGRHPPGGLPLLQPLPSPGLEGDPGWRGFAPPEADLVLPMQNPVS